MKMERKQKWTTNTQHLGLIKLFRGPWTDPLKEKRTKSLVRIYIKKVLIVQAHHP